VIRDPQKRFKPQALLSTNLAYTAEQMLTWCVRRWTIEVTFEAARAHLGMETQRQWNDRAIARATPALLSLYSIVTLSMRALAWRAMLPDEVSRRIAACDAHRGSTEAAMRTP
jgi:hypothetical protein